MGESLRSSRDVIIRTADMNAAVDFYEHILGLAVTMRSDAVVGFETGAIQLFVEGGEPLPAVLDFLVPDIQEAKQRLVAAGCAVIEENPAVPRCYVRDPFGLLFNLGQG
jgi:catechol 2,3-dioxygenase-like lactoylglutathione lyase family enzyme